MSASKLPVSEIEPEAGRLGIKELVVVVAEVGEDVFVLCILSPPVEVWGIGEVELPPPPPPQDKREIIKKYEILFFILDRILLRLNKLCRHL